MTPDTMAKSGTEHGHQRAFFQWLTIAANYGFGAACDDLSYVVAGHAKRNWHAMPTHPELNLFHAIPNGGERGDGTAKGRAIAGSKMKAEGVKPGVLDTFLPVSKPFSVSTHSSFGSHMFNGLYIEFKAPKFKTRKGGGVSPAQDVFMEAVRYQGYCCRVAYSWREAANLVMLYYGETIRLDTH